VLDRSVMKLSPFGSDAFANAFDDWYAPPPELGWPNT
jgi:hypothetical protein